MESNSGNEDVPDLTDDELRRLLDVLANRQWHDTGSGLTCNYCGHNVTYDHGETRPWLPDCGPLGRPCLRPDWL
jgi:hypothetical protein